MKRKQSKRQKTKTVSARARVKKARMQLPQLSNKIPIELKRLKEIVSQRAVDLALPLTRFAQNQLHTLETKLSRA